MGAAALLLPKISLFPLSSSCDDGQNAKNAGWCVSAWLLLDLESMVCKGVVLLSLVFRRCCDAAGRLLSKVILVL